MPPEDVRHIVVSGPAFLCFLSCSSAPDCQRCGTAYGQGGVQEEPVKDSDEAWLCHSHSRGLAAWQLPAVAASRLLHSMLLLLSPAVQRLWTQQRPAAPAALCSQAAEARLAMRCLSSTSYCPSVWASCCPISQCSRALLPQQHCCPPSAQAFRSRMPTFIPQPRFANCSHILARFSHSPTPM